MVNTCSKSAYMHPFNVLEIFDESNKNVDSNNILFMQLYTIYAISSIYTSGTHASNLFPLGVLNKVNYPIIQKCCARVFTVLFFIFFYDPTLMDLMTYEHFVS